MEGAGEGCGFFCSLKLPYLSIMSQPSVADCLNHKSGHTSLRKLIQLLSFRLGCKTPGGFLFATFDFIVPILEQLEYGRFRYFQCMTLRVTLNMP